MSINWFAVCCKFRMALLILLTTAFSLPTGFSQNPPVGFNYDEAKVGTYTLPDPLVMAGGHRVSNARDWAKRRQEILRLFEINEYGRTPKSAKNAGRMT
ncbi:MAG: hypothetical protein M3X11_05585, partial [Acidobacteriota bacterium]|nr:hypothetical protein [Acidobacteriota bacterium]